MLGGGDAGAEVRRNAAELGVVGEAVESGKVVGERGRDAGEPAIGVVMRDLSPISHANPISQSCVNRSGASLPFFFSSRCLRTQFASCWFLGYTFGTQQCEFLFIDQRILAISMNLPFNPPPPLFSVLRGYMFLYSSSSRILWSHRSSFETAAVDPHTKPMDVSLFSRSGVSLPAFLCSRWRKTQLARGLLSFHRYGTLQWLCIDRYQKK